MTADHATSPVRLLKVVPTLLCGGTEHQVVTLGHGLDTSRFALRLACLRRVGPFVADLERRQTPLSEYPISTFRSLRALAQQARFARDVVRHGIQIVHAYNFYGNVFAIPPARLAAAPVVIASIRDRGLYLTPTQTRVQRQICRLADCVLVNADAVKTWLVGEGYDADAIHVIRNGVDLDRFGDSTDDDAVRASLDLPAGARIVAVVSRLNRLKGIEHFLEAAALLAPRFPDVFFLVVGEPSLKEPQYLEVLRVLAARRGLARRALFTGRRADVPALLAAATVSVMPSLNEALPNVVLESMAAGAPTVATRVGGTPEVMTDGVTGLLVEPGDPGAIAAAVATLLDDPALAARLGRAGRERVERRFSIDRMIEATERLYLDLLARKCRINSPASLPTRTGSGRQPRLESS